MNSHESYDDIDDSDFSSLMNFKYVLSTKHNIEKTQKASLITYSPFQKIELIILRIIPLSFALFVGIPYAFSLYSTIPLVYHSISSSPFDEMITQLMLVSFLSKMPLSFKLSCLFGCFLFITIGISYAALINQRMSVPEYEDENTKSPFIIISALITSSLLMFLLFNTSSYFSQLITFGDNILFLLFMIASFVFSVLCYATIQVIDFNASTAQASLFFVMKTTLIALMVIMGMNYIAGLSFLTYATTPFVNVYNMTLINLFFLFTFSSAAVYFFAFILYVTLLQRDLDYLYKTLLIRPDIEYFVDFNIRKVL